jgi:hypothetical protein
MSATLALIRHRLQEIATAATTAAEALDGAAVDYLDPEVLRLLWQLDHIEARLAKVCDRLSAGVDPQPEGRRG